MSQPRGDDSSNPSICAQILSPDKLTPAQICHWDALCSAHSHLASPFFSFQYTLAMAAVRPYVRVCLINIGSRPVAFFPFEFEDTMHRVLRAAQRVGGELTDHFGIIAPPTFRITSKHLLGLARLDHMYFTHLDETQLLHGLQGQSPETGLSIHLDPGKGAYWDDLKQRDRKFASDTERRERKLIANLGALRFTFCESNWSQALNHLLEQKRRQYALTGRSDPLAPSWVRRLLSILAASHAENCRGVLSTLFAGDTWVASHFGLRHDGLLAYWFPVYNPELSGYAPGRLLLKAIIQSSQEIGVRMIDRGVGESHAKKDFANGQHRFYRGVWSRPGLRFLTSQLMTSIKWRFSNK